MYTKSILLTLDMAFPKSWIAFWTGFTRPSIRLLSKEGTFTVQHFTLISVWLPLQSTPTTILKYTEYWSYVTPTHFLNKGGLSSFKLGSLCMISLWMMARRICRDLTSSSSWPCRSFSSISSSSLNEILWRDRNLWVVFIEDSLLTYLRNFS